MKFLDALREPPEPLTLPQRKTVIAATALVAITRLLARGHSMWDWDEALFCLGVRDYNVVQHQPHPPGYPLFVLAAKFFRLFGASEFLALQIVVLLAGAALLPLLFFFAREARFPFASAFGGALLFVFLPNVWIYSGTALSDVPALALTLLACALLLRGCRSRGAYLCAVASLALAVGIRPQALVVGAACAAASTYIRWRDDKRFVDAAVLIAVAIVAASYGGAALASDPPNKFLETVRAQSDWVNRVDSYRNPGRTPLRILAQDFFYRPVRANSVRAVAILALLGALAGLALRRRPVLIALATFGPFAISAWLMLDASAISRYAIGYMPLHALLAADVWSLPFRRPRARAIAPLAASGVLAAAMIWWAWPAATVVRSHDAPPILALRWIRKNVRPGATIFVHNGFRPFADYFLQSYDHRGFETVDEIPTSGYVEPAYVVTGAVSDAPGAQSFSRPHETVWRIVRQRFFEASVIPAWNVARFGRGWYDAEGDGLNGWRWMGRTSEVVLPSVGARGKLTVKLFVPLDGLAAPPTIDVQLNGAPLDHFIATAEELEKTWTVASRVGAPNELRLATSDAVIPARVHPGGDSRELGLKLEAIRWQPTP